MTAPYVIDVDCITCGAERWVEGFAEGEMLPCPACRPMYKIPTQPHGASDAAPDTDDSSGAAAAGLPAIEDRHPPVGSLAGGPQEPHMKEGGDDGAAGQGWPFGGPATAEPTTDVAAPEPPSASRRCGDREAVAQPDPRTAAGEPQSQGRGAA